MVSSVGIEGFSFSLPLPARLARPFEPLVDEEVAAVVRI
jgi:hypothetical protein